MPRALILSLVERGNPDAVKLRGLYPLASKVDFPAGKTIFSEGEPANTVYALSNGFVRLYKSLPDGRRQVLAFALAGDFLGMPLHEHYSCSADAIGEVVACRFSRAAFSNFVQTSPSTLRWLNELAVRELDMAHELLLLIGKASAEERIMKFLVNWCNQLARLGPSPEVTPLPMLRQDIADLLGLTLETVSRTSAKLQEKNVLRVVPKGVIRRGLEEIQAKLADTKGRYNDRHMRMRSRS